MGYGPGASERSRTHPGRTLTGEPFWTDGRRAVAAITAEPADLRFLEWDVARVPGGPSGSD
jgi:hypothetical protein